MANVIDKIVVALGIDTTAARRAFIEGAQVAVKEHEKTQKATRETTREANKAADGFAALTRNALMFFGALVGARSVEQFVRNLTTADAALGRLAASLGRGPDTVAAFGMAVERSGGNAKSATASFAGFVDSLTEMRLTGDTAILPWIAKLGAASGKNVDLQAKAEEQLLQVSEQLEIVARRNPAEASFLGRRLGLDPDTVSFLMRGPTYVRATLAEARKSAPTKSDTDAARALETSLVGLSQSVADLGRKIVTELSPWLTALIKQISSWVEQNQEWLKSEIVQGVRDFAAYLKSIPWGKIGEGAKSIIGDLKVIVSEMGGFIRATEILFGLWLGGKALGAVNALRMAAGLSPLAALGGMAVGAAIGGAAFAYGELTETDAQRAERLRQNPGADRNGPVDFAIRGVRAVGRFLGSGGSGRATDEKRSEMMGYAQDELRKLGVPDSRLRAAAAQLVGQADMESGLNPSAVHDQGTGYGIYGARLDRRDKMFKWLSENGYRRDSSEGQMRYMAREAMSGSYPATKQTLMNADEGSLAAGSHVLTREFERPLISNDRSGAVSRAYRQGGPKTPTVTAPPPGMGARSSLMNRPKAAVTNTSQTEVGGVTIVTTPKEQAGARDLAPILQKSSRAMLADYGLA